MKKNNDINIMILMPALRTGGAERVIVNFSNWIIDNTKSKITICCFENNNSIYDIKKDVNIICGNIFHKNRFLDICRRLKFLKKTLKNEKPDVIFTVFPSVFLYALFTRNKQAKLIFSERANIKFSSKPSQLLCKFVALKSDGIIFQTQRAMSTYPKSIYNRSCVIPNAIEIDSTNILKHETQKNITAVGRLCWQKGFDTLIKAFKLVSNDYPDYKLIIYGEGEDRNYLEQIIKDLNLTGSVLLPGIKKDVINYVANSTLFILSSRYEGMPNALMEAMAVGVPSISTDCEFGPSELINNGENGILVPVDDVEKLSENIKLLLSNKELYNKIKSNCQKILSTNSNEKIYKNYYEFITKFVKEKD